MHRKTWRYKDRIAQKIRKKLVGWLGTRREGRVLTSQVNSDKEERRNVRKNRRNSERKDEVKKVGSEEQQRNKHHDDDDDDFWVLLSLSPTGKIYYT